jgi:tetrahydromethanopterin S-methyltransferase subunit G
MNWERLEARLERIEEKLDDLQPLVDEYKASKIVIKKVKDWGKILGVAMGLVLGSFTIIDRIHK